MKIGIVGAGRIANFHYEAFKAAGAEVAAVCTRGETGQTFAKERGMNYYSSLHELIEKESPEAVCLLTQPSSYPSLLEVVKAKNIPTFLEKPVSYSYQEGSDLKKLLPEKVMVGQNRRFYSNINKVMNLLDNNKVSAHVFINERAKDIRLRDQRDRDNWHVMNGIHGVDLMKYMFGNPEKMLFQSQWQDMDFSRLKQFNSAVFETTKGHRVFFNSNFDSPGGWRIHFFYSETEVSVLPIEKTSIKSISGGLTEVEVDKVDTEYKQGFYAQAKCFLDGVRGDLPKEWVHYDDALDSIELTEKLYATL